VIVTDLTPIVFLYQRHQPEGGQITGWNKFMKILWIKIHH